jgi:adenosylcobinamide-GDP ribazoletransferase
MRRFLIALQFLTVLPFNIKGKIEEKDFGGSLVYFPIVGFLIGLFLVSAAYMSAFLPSLVRSVLILVAWVIITGGMHLDGFADTCDGFYGRRSKEEILKIMRDSRIGTMGAAGVTILLLFKFAMLSSIQPENLWTALIITAVFSRWSQVLACTTSEYARDDGKARYFIEYAKGVGMFMGALFTLILSWFLMQAKGVILFALLSITVFLFIQYAERKIGGMTGDTIGATNEVAEAAALFFNVMLLNYKIC